jgi:hypothetical protein
MSSFQSRPPLLYAGFIQDSTHFAIGTTDGFRIYAIEPFGLILNGGTGGILSIQIYKKSNCFGFVAAGPSSNIVVIWDDSQKTQLFKLEFSVPVKSIKLHQNLSLLVTQINSYLCNASFYIFAIPKSAKSIPSRCFYG